MPAYFSTEKQPVDVFWVYPTILSDDVTHLMNIKDSALREKAHWTLVEQASIFDGQANIYAPFYRQNNVKINPRISNNLFFRQKVLSFRTLSSMYGDFQQLWSQPGISRAL